MSHCRVAGCVRERRVFSCIDRCEEIWLMVGRVEEGRLCVGAGAALAKGVFKDVFVFRLDCSTEKAGGG